MAKPKPIAKQPLTKRQQKMLDWIRGFIAENSLSPTPEMIAEKFEISLGNVSRYTDILCEKGYLVKDSSKRPPVIEVIA